MSQYLKNPKYIHIAVELMYATMMTYYVYSRNNVLQQRIHSLEFRLKKTNEILEEHTVLIRELQTSTRDTSRAVVRQVSTKVDESLTLQQELERQRRHIERERERKREIQIEMENRQRQSPPTPVVEEETDDEEVESVVTDACYEENLDEEIHKELNKLKKLKTTEETL